MGGVRARAHVVNGDICYSDSMMQCFHSLKEAAKALVGGSDLVLADFGDHPGTAWEVRQELLSGSPLLRWDALGPSIKETVEALVSEASQLPEAALQGSGALALRHPAWRAVRLSAQRFLVESASFSV